MCIEDRPEGGALAGEGKHGSINFDGRHNMGVNRNVGGESRVSVAPATGLGEWSGPLARPGYATSVGQLVEPTAVPNIPALASGLPQYLGQPHNIRRDPPRPISFDPNQTSDQITRVYPLQ